MLHWESIGELNAFRVLDCDPDVTHFSEQPCQIRYVEDGAERGSSSCSPSAFS